MSQPTPNMLYTTGTATSSTAAFVTVFANTDPNPSNTQFSVQQRWINLNTGAEFILAGYTSFNGSIQSNWLEITEGSSNVQTVTGNSGGAVGATAGNINIIGDTTTITFVGNPGTSTLTANVILPASAHQVLVGEITSIAGITPSVTAGIPLISQGTSADPIFGTAVVSGGGTGITSATAYGLITGGTTSTGNMQVIAPNASTHAVLVSQGTSALPIFTTTGSLYVTSISFNAGTDTLDTYIGRTTWTPVLTFGGLSTGITYSTQSGVYEVIGSIATYYFSIQLTSVGSATGTASITGFPYTAATDFSSIGLYYTDLTLPAGINDVLFVPENQGGSAEFSGVGSNQPETLLTEVNFTNTTFISVSGYVFI